MMKILVLGAGGQLGGELCRQLDKAAVGWRRADLDLERLHDIVPRVLDLRPDAVINAAAYTQVDRAEDEAERCWRINAHAVEALAEVCQRLECRFLHVSTDYVFGDDPRDAPRPFQETDAPNPRGEYARSKLAGELAARKCERHVVIRTCGLYARPEAKPRKGRNFVDTMRCLGETHSTLRVVQDQVCTPSYVPHVAEAMAYLLNSGATGTYHVVNIGHTNWYEFACEIFQRAGRDVSVVPITTAEYGARAPRPRFSVLDTTKYQQLGGPALPPWRQGLIEYFQEAAFNESART